MQLTEISFNSFLKNLSKSKSYFLNISISINLYNKNTERLGNIWNYLSNSTK